MINQEKSPANLGVLIQKGTFTPSQIVRELNRYIIGQDAAKRAVAIALRNRWRRQRVKGMLKDEIYPNNILMIGPTGVGKTEIARRLAQLAEAPFVKIEASKFTEVGYVGRDVESMIRDLVEISVKMVREEKTLQVQTKADEHARERIIDLLLPPPPPHQAPSASPETSPYTSPTSQPPTDTRAETKAKLRKMLDAGRLDERTVEIHTSKEPSGFFDLFRMSGMDDINIELQEMLKNALPRKSKTRKVTVKDALRILTQEEAAKLINMDEVISQARERAENSGIVFVDEIDKIATGEGTAGGHGPDVSREGVQRDLLPIIEGSNVSTKYGLIRTDHILFIAAGAFHKTKPSDLLPELQGRMPLRVELSTLTKQDFERILTEPETALLKQYQALVQTENAKLTFTKDAVTAVAEVAVMVNDRSENIGARRLHTVMTTLLEDYLFDLPESGTHNIRITGKEVREKLDSIVADEDLSQYIL
ncbi:ATP-dependent protease ATPase subunit HslU [candidate division WOR-3 bacterium]|uniref:ATP-dependent protease ATPase subunit HslU n=1 Tax=candidate division WOR-3 bacterium TaxID=2052148 RepID=A0A9D5K962_UNCW3|nr:ATP-dependent protease ATPase subunit HslU [candidate division WOR-3 bacterium]MBD3364758.1 ATP-dependent protease ATPase subunit HslU [candidate division WOR-3 bacterium]